MKRRADQLLVDRGLAESRARAQALIMAGKVFAGTRRIEKPGMALADETALEVRGQDHPWVSRGGLKLDHALRFFRLSPARRICIDVGASTGGFTDVLLFHGAAKVHAVDVGHGQLAWKLRSDPRVVVHEKTNARYLTAGDIQDTIEALVCDASFIGLATLLPAPLALCAGRMGGGADQATVRSGPRSRRPQGRGTQSGDARNGVRARANMVGRVGRLVCAGRHRKPDHRAGRQQGIPDRSRAQQPIAARAKSEAWYSTSWRPQGPPSTASSHAASKAVDADLVGMTRWR